MKDPATIELALSIAVAIIMLGMGMGLTMKDFKRVTEQPIGVLAGLLNQLVLLPLVAFGLVMLFGLTKEAAVGIMLLSACPGGATSNLITNLAKGNMGLSITLTAISSMVTVFTIPFIVNFSLDRFLGTEEAIELSFLEMFTKVMLVTVIPVITGMLLRRVSEKVADKMEKPVKIASVILMAAIIIGAVKANWDKLSEALPEVGPAVIALNIVTMLIGFFSGLGFKLPLKDRVSISIETGIQNATLALFVGGLGGMALFPKILLAPALYGVLMFITGGVLAAIFGKLVTKSENA